MRENDDLLGLGTLWDLEVANSSWDERREGDRLIRARRHLSDALASMARNDPLAAMTDNLDRWLHVRVLGMNWVDGYLCGSRARVVIPHSAVSIVRANSSCGCNRDLAKVVEWVPLSAVLRQWERRATTVTVMTARQSVTGRVVGVWRDAIQVRSMTSLTVVSLLHVVVVVETESGGS